MRRRRSGSWGRSSGCDLDNSRVNFAIERNRNHTRKAAHTHTHTYGKQCRIVTCVFSISPSFPLFPLRFLRFFRFLFHPSPPSSPSSSSPFYAVRFCVTIALHICPQVGFPIEYQVRVSAGRIESCSLLLLGWLRSERDQDNITAQCKLAGAPPPTPSPTHPAPPLAAVNGIQTEPRDVTPERVTLRIGGTVASILQPSIVWLASLEDR